MIFKQSFSLQIIMKMNQRKRWLSQICNELQQKDFDISWSTSDSDNETTHEIPSQKRKKVDVNKKSKTWISIVAVENQDVTASKDNSQSNRKEKSLEVSSALTSSCVKDDFLDSPVIESFKPEKSPSLLDDLNSTNSSEKSPVISRRNILKKIRWRCKLRKGAKLTQKIQDDSSNSPGLFISEPSIIAIDSQSSPDKSSPIEISPTKSEISQSYKIDPFPSQQSSEIVTSSSTSSSEFKSSLYHEPPPRKKHYKKGGLASQLHKAVESERTSLAIWKHELYLSTSRGEEVESEAVGNKKVTHFPFKIIDKWKEYGCTVLECKFMDEVDSCKLSSNFPHLQIETDVFLVIIGMDISINTCFELGKCYKIFPPYTVRMIDYQQKDTLCFISTYRIVPFN